MNNHLGNCKNGATALAQASLAVTLLVMLLFGAPASAETVVEEIPYDDGNDSVVSVEPIEPLSTAELGDLVGPIALYPDDLIAIVLPASTYPLQIVQATRFLEARKTDEGLEPSEDWDDSVVALLNYPEVLELMNTDLDWTWKLGEAVLIQQEEVIAAVGDFRQRARLAGNLKSDERQIVEVVDDGAIEIRPADPEVIYVPYYEPSRVTVYHDYPVYHYYPRRYPVYYYPYPAGYAFSSGYFWGVTSAFSIGWSTHHLHQHYYGYAGHPYYGRRYYDYHYYRRPHLSLSRNHYYSYMERYPRPVQRHHAGNYWHPRHDRHGASPRYRDRYSRHVERNPRRMELRDGRRNDFERHRGQRDQRDGRRDGRSDSDRHGPSRQQQLADQGRDPQIRSPRRPAQLDDMKRARRDPVARAAAGPGLGKHPGSDDRERRVIARGTNNPGAVTRGRTSREVNRSERHDRPVAPPVSAPGQHRRAQVAAQRPARDVRHTAAIERGRQLARMKVEGRPAAVRAPKPQTQPSSQRPVMRRAPGAGPKAERRAQQRSEPRQVAAAPTVERGSKVRANRDHGNSARSNRGHGSGRSHGFRRER